jgi:hypothetical protein
MRKLMALVVLICGAASADAAEPEYWCAAGSAEIKQTEGTYFLHGKPVEVERRHEEGFPFIKYDGNIFALCNAASAAMWCSSGFGERATLISADGGISYVLKIGNRTETFKFVGGIGTGLKGYLLVARDGTTEIVNSADVVNAGDPNYPETLTVWLFRDRVFWPCEP